MSLRALLMVSHLRDAAAADVFVAAGVTLRQHTP